MFLIEARLSPLALASEKSTYPIPPAVDLTAWATPPLPLPVRPVVQLSVLPEPRVQSVGSAFLRYNVKLLVVPDESERWTGVILVEGNDAPELSAAMAGSFQV